MMVALWVSMARKTEDEEEAAEEEGIVVSI